MKMLVDRQVSSIVVDPAKLMLELQRSGIGQTRNQWPVPWFQGESVHPGYPLKSSIRTGLRGFAGSTILHRGALKVLGH